MAMNLNVQFLKHILLIDMVRISCQIALRMMMKDLIDDRWSPVQEIF